MSAHAWIITDRVCGNWFLPLCCALARRTLPGRLNATEIKAPWNDLHEFNVCNPNAVSVPTHVIVGQQDPYVSEEAQRDLFQRLGTSDKAWTVLPESDHAAHILQRRHMFVRAVVGFLTRANGPMMDTY